MKNRILLANYYLSGALEHAIGRFIDYYNLHRCNESLGNLTPADSCFGRAKAIQRRQQIRRKTIVKRRLLYRQIAA